MECVSENPTIKLMRYIFNQGNKKYEYEPPLNSASHCLSLPGTTGPVISHKSCMTQSDSHSIESLFTGVLTLNKLEK